MQRKEKNDMERNTGILRDQWLRSSEARKMLGIPSGTLQNFRVKRTPAYTKVGEIVFYRYDDIVKMLNSHNFK